MRGHLSKKSRACVEALLHAGADPRKQDGRVARASNVLTLLRQVKDSALSPLILLADQTIEQLKGKG